MTIPNLTASFILDSLTRHHSGAAIIPEMVLSDDDWADRWNPDDGRPITKRRIDALMIQGHRRTAIEIKTTLPDFKRDTWDKRRPWARIVHRFVYAVPHGMTFPTGGPSHYQGCGLWWIDDQGRVTVARKATISPYPEPLPNQIIQALAYRAAGRPQITR